MSPYRWFTILTLSPGRFPRLSNILSSDLYLGSRPGVHSVGKLVQLLEALQANVNIQVLSRGSWGGWRWIYGKVNFCSQPEVGESHSARKVRTLGCLSVFNLFTADLFIGVNVIIIRWIMSLMPMILASLTTRKFPISYDHHPSFPLKPCNIQLSVGSPWLSITDENRSRLPCCPMFASVQPPHWPEWRSKSGVGRVSQCTSIN